MIELLIGFFIGRATKGLNPLQVCIGILGALVILAFLGLTAYAVWTYAPQAAEAITRLAIMPDYVTDYLQIESVTDGDVLKYLSQLSKRTVICIIALMFIGMGLMIFSWALGLALKPVSKLLQMAIARARG